jgi:hypothetical protein
MQFFREHGEKKREKKFIDDKHMIVELLTRGKEVIVKWLLGLLVWVVAVVVV